MGSGHQRPYPLQRVVPCKTSLTRKPHLMWEEGLATLGNLPARHR